MPVVRIGDIKNFEIDISNAMRVQTSQEYENYQIQNGDLLIAMFGATTCKMGIYTLQKPAYLNQRVGILKVKSNEIIPEYRNFALYALQVEIYKRAYGGAQPNISKGVIESLKIPLLPLDIQKRIVSKLDEAFSRIDNGVKHLKSAKENITKYKQSLLKAAFSGTLTDESSQTSWQVKTLGEVCEILDNMRKPINAIEREQRLKNSTHKYAYYGATGQVGYIDDFLCDFESILLGEDGAPFLEPFKDKAYIVSGKYWVNNYAHILRAKEKVAVNKFVCHFLNIVDYMPYVSGTTRLKLNQSAMKSIKIPLPPLQTQKQIVELLEKHLTSADKTSEFIESALNKAKQLKSSLLKSAFLGKLT